MVTSQNESEIQKSFDFWYFGDILRNPYLTDVSIKQTISRKQSGKHSFLFT